MAELVQQHRGRRGNTEREETAIAVMGPIVRRERGPAGIECNQNHDETRTNKLTDELIIDELRNSGRVSIKELCSYITPAGLLQQSDKIDPIVDAIRDIINNMARTRRIILHSKLRKINNATEDRALRRQLDRWPVQVQQMHGQIVELKGRCLRIPQNLVDDIVLLD